MGILPDSYDAAEGAHIPLQSTSFGSWPTCFRFSIPIKVHPGAAGAQAVGSLSPTQNFQTGFQAPDFGLVQLWPL